MSQRGTAHKRGGEECGQKATSMREVYEMVVKQPGGCQSETEADDLLWRPLKGAVERKVVHSVIRFNSFRIYEKKLLGTIHRQPEKGSFYYQNFPGFTNVITF